MLRIAVVIAALAFASPVLAAAPDPVVHTGAATSPIASSVAVPPGYTTVYVSGMVPAVAHPEAEKGSIASFGTTEEQTESVLGKIEAELKAQGMTFKDVVQMRVYLAGDPAMGGKMDFAGMMKAYSRHFGTADQPNKPARATIQVAALAAPGFLVEIEVVAVKPAG